MPEEISIGNITTTQTRFPLLRTYQKVDRSSIEKCENKNNVPPEDLSKSSEKNDKLMLHKNTLKSNIKCDSFQNNYSKTVRIQSNNDNVIESSSDFKLDHTSNSPSISLVSEISLQKSANVFETIEPIFETKSNGSTLPDFDRNSKGKGYVSGTHSKLSELNIKTKNSSESGSINEVVSHLDHKINKLALTSNQCNAAFENLSPQQASQTSESDSVSMPKNNNSERNKMTQNTEKKTYFSRSQNNKLEQTEKFNVTGMFSINSNQNTRLYSKDDNELKEVKKVQIKIDQSFNVDSNVSFFYHGKLTKERTESNLDPTSEHITKKTELDNYDGKSLLGQKFSLLKSKERTLEIVSSFSNFEDNSQDEDFVGTNNELYTKDSTFSGFNDVLDKNQSTNEKFHDFLRRLSESENETCHSASLNTADESPYQPSNESFSLDSPTKQSNSINKCTEKNNISINTGTLDTETSCISFLSNCKSMDLKKTSINYHDAKENVLDNKKLDIEINCSEMEDLEISVKERIKESLMEIKQQFKPGESSFGESDTATSYRNDETVKDKFDLISNEINSSYFDKSAGAKNIRSKVSSHGNGFFGLKKTKENKRENSSFTKLNNRIETIVLDNDISNCDSSERKGNDTMNKELSSHFTDKDLLLVTSSLEKKNSNQSSKATCITKDVMFDTQPGLSLFDSTVENKPGDKPCHKKSQNSSHSLLQRKKLPTEKPSPIKKWENSEIKKSLNKMINENNDLTSGLHCDSPVKNKDVNYSCTDNESEVRSVETRQENTGILCSEQSTNENDRNQTEQQLVCVNEIHEELSPNYNNTPTKRGKQQKLKVPKNKRVSVQDSKNVILYLDEHKTHQYSQNSNRLKLIAFDSPSLELKAAANEENIPGQLINDKLNVSNITVPVFVPCEEVNKSSEKKNAVKEDSIKFGEEEKINSTSKNFKTQKVVTNNYTKNTTIPNGFKNTKSSPSTLTNQEICYSSPQNKKRGRPPKVKLIQTVNDDLLKFEEVENKNLKGKNSNTLKEATNNHIKNAAISSVCNNTTLSPSTLPIPEVCYRSPQNKRRGRPPKVKFNQTASGDLLQGEEVEKNNSIGNCDTPKVSNNFIENTAISSFCNNTLLSPSTSPIQEVCNSSLQNKKRGRPQKIKSNQTVSGDLLQMKEVEKNNSIGKHCDTSKVAKNNCIENTSSSSIFNNKKSPPLTVPTQEDLNSSPQKKRRGRPPKIKVTQIDKAINEDISAEAGKNDCLLKNERLPTSTNSKRKNKPYQEEKLIEPIFDTPLCSNRNKTLPKKRGRKAKANNDQVEISASDDDNVPLSKRVKHVPQNNDNFSNVNSQHKITPDMVFHGTKKSVEKRKKIVFDEYSDQESLQTLEPVKKPLGKSKKRYSHFKNGSQVYFGQNYTLQDKVSK